MEQLRRIGYLGWVRQILHRELTRPCWATSYQSAKPSSPGSGIIACRAEFNSVGDGRAAFSVLALNNIAPNPGAHRRAKRVGRGIGSGKGKTAGRGHKGQGARSKVKRFFEGGQTPLRISVPKRGFINAHKRELNYVNIDRVLELVQVGKIDASKPITLKTLYDARVFKKLRDGLKLLARGGENVTQPLHFQVTAVSDTAKDCIEQAGGKVVKTYYNELGLRALCKPESFHAKGRRIPNPARPPPKLAPKFQIVGTIPACQTLEEFEKNWEERKVEDLTNYYWMEKEPFKATTPGKRFEAALATKIRQQERDPKQRVHIVNKRGNDS